MAGNTFEDLLSADQWKSLQNGLKERKSLEKHMIVHQRSDKTNSVKKTPRHPSIQRNSNDSSPATIQFQELPTAGMHCLKGKKESSPTQNVRTVQDKSHFDTQPSTVTSSINDNSKPVARKLSLEEIHQNRAVKLMHYCNCNFPHLGITDIVVELFLHERYGAIFSLFDKSCDYYFNKQEVLERDKFESEWKTAHDYLYWFVRGKDGKHLNSAPQTIKQSRSSLPVSFPKQSKADKKKKAKKDVLGILSILMFGAEWLHSEPMGPLFG